MRPARQDLPPDAAHGPNGLGFSTSEEVDGHEGAWLVGGPVTAPPARGAAVFAFLGGLVGVLVGGAISLLGIAGLSFSGRAVLFGGIGLLAGAAAGFVYGAGRDDDADDRRQIM